MFSSTCGLLCLLDGLDRDEHILAARPKGEHGSDIIGNAAPGERDKSKGASWGEGAAQILIRALNHDTEALPLGKFNINNRICFLSATNAGVIQGTDVGDTATYMDIDWLDTGNNTPVPTLGTGARYSARYGTHGTFQGLNSVALALGVTPGNAVTSRSELETAAGIYNIWATNENASGYVIIAQTATHRWGLGQDNSANWVFDKLAGSGGFVEVPKLRIASIPTSASGLTSGEVWSNAGILTIVA